MERTMKLALIIVVVSVVSLILVKGLHNHFSTATVPADDTASWTLTAMSGQEPLVTDLTII
ncbi:MAG: hypothetical protein R3301_06955 [Saprospiraceae bacterium]|nr:hypothetical protein [Saprospiraceae bacterium]